jgi:ATP-binding cassette subfamily C (CFTR/MRP) protein 4
LIATKAASGSLWNMTEHVINNSAAYQNISSANSTTTNITEWGWLPSTQTCIYVYSGLLSLIVVFVLCSVICFSMMCMRASTNLHNTMFSSITQATMWFFNNSPSGNFDDAG